METENLLKRATSQAAKIDSETSKISEGILLVDKPSGVSSHKVVNWTRKNSGIKKVGHTGTLDPLATGLLILLIGRKYTKQQAKFLKQEKSYEATVWLGIATDSYDIDGNILQKNSWESVSKISEFDLQEAINSFLGSYEQQVPIFSAVKIDGQKLYEVAHAAQTDQGARKEYEKIMQALPTRLVTISEIRLENFHKNEEKKKVEFSISVTCSSGTYIRSLAVDIGKKLGLYATVTQLRRTAIADISIHNAKVCPFITFT